MRFGLAKARAGVLVSILDENEDAVVDLLAELEVPALYLGETGGEHLSFDGEKWHSLEDAMQWDATHLSTWLG